MKLGCNRRIFIASVNFILRLNLSYVKMTLDLSYGNRKGKTYDYTFKYCEKGY